MTDKKIQIKLKAARLKSGLSLSRTAELTGVSKAMLHQIERGDSSPTIATLWKLAKGFHLPLTAFIEDMIQTGDTFTPARKELISFPESIGFHTVFPFDPVFGSETFLVTLEAEQTHTSNSHDVGVVEEVFVKSGLWSQRSWLTSSFIGPMSWRRLARASRFRRPGHTEERLWRRRAQVTPPTCSRRLARTKNTRSTLSRPPSGAMRKCWSRC